MNRLHLPAAVLFATLLHSHFATHAGAAEGGQTKITFKRTQLESKFRSEGTAVGDFNHDGKLDISAGSVYYAAPEWKMQMIAVLKRGQN